MSQAYRDSTEALRRELHDLRGRLGEIDKDIERMEALRRQGSELRDQIAELSARLSEAERRDAMPLLDRVRIASPCSASWEEMVGSDRQRHCGHCDKDVFNVLGMTRDEAEALLRENSAGVCLRIYRRADGTVMTSDCGVGLRRKKRRLTLFAFAGAATAVAGGWSLLATTGDAVVMGAMEHRAEPDQQVHQPDQQIQQVVMGAPIPFEDGTETAEPSDSTTVPQAPPHLPVPRPRAR